MSIIQKYNYIMDLSNLELGKDCDKELFDNIDKKIKLRFEKQKKTSRTLIEGLHYFFTSEETDVFCQKMKKKLGTSCLKTILPDGTTEIGFNGDHRMTLKKLFIEELHIDKDQIVI